MLINLEHLKSFFNNQQVLSSELQEKIKEYETYHQSGFSMNDFKSLDMSDWIFESKTQSNKSYFNKANKNKFQVLLKNKNEMYPFFIYLTLNNTKGSPCIIVSVYNQYDLNSKKLEKEIVLKSRSKKQSLYDEIVHYWNSGRVMEQLVKGFDKNDVTYEQVAQKIKGKNFVDYNGKKIPQYQANMIAYLYEKVKAQKLHTLSDEPSDWGVPDSVSNRFSSGFVDCLQDAYQLNTDNSQKEYGEFFKSYPDIDSYIKSFDSRYF